MKVKWSIVMVLVAMVVIMAGVYYTQNKSYMLAFGVLDESLEEIAFVDPIYSKVKSETWETLIIKEEPMGKKDFEVMVLPSYYLDLRIKGVHYTLSVWDEGEKILIAFDYVMSLPYTLEAETYKEIGRLEYEALYVQKE